MKYYITGNIRLINEKCKMKYDFDIEPFINKETKELKINDDNFYKIAGIIADFLAPLGLIEAKNLKGDE